MSNPGKSLVIRLALGILVPILALTQLLLPLCSALFQCGCTWECQGADEFCNVRLLPPPHCQWCSNGWWGWHLPLGFMLLATGLSLWFTSMRWVNRAWVWLMLSVLAIEVWPIVAAALTCWWTGYPTFLGWTVGTVHSIGGS